MASTIELETELPKMLSFLTLFQSDTIYARVKKRRHFIRRASFQLNEKYAIDQILLRYNY